MRPSACSCAGALPHPARPLWGRPRLGGRRCAHVLLTGSRRVAAVLISAVAVDADPPQPLLRGPPRWPCCQRSSPSHSAVLRDRVVGTGSATSRPASGPTATAPTSDGVRPAVRVVPVAIGLLEPPGSRRPALAALGLAGAYTVPCSSSGLADGRGAITACSYYWTAASTGASTNAGVMYVVATCGALLLSGQRPLVIWGIANVGRRRLLALAEGAGLPSLRCFWRASRRRRHVRWLVAVERNWVSR